MSLPAPFKTVTYRVFLSSGADVIALRDRTEKLCDVASEVLSRHDHTSRIEVDRWEDAPPHAIEPEDDLNDEFVQRALASHLVVALLRSEIRPGTLQELEAVLENGGPDVAVFCFATEEPRSDELTNFLEKWRNHILYKEVGAPDSNDAWYELVRSIIDLTVQIILRDGSTEAYVERY